jgi:DNA replication protein DnaC
MLTAPTMEKLHSLRLEAMAGSYAEQQRAPDITGLAFDERFGMLVDAEYLARDNRRVTARLREAKLKLPQASIEDIDYEPRRRLDRAVIRQLATCRWIEEHHNILITGLTGTGKSYFGCAFGTQACRRGFRVLYYRASRLFDDFVLARATGGHVRLLAKLARMDVLIIDDWALRPLAEQDRHDLLEIFEDRYDLRSTIMTSQLEPEKWHEQIGEPTMADAILDRVVHRAHRIALKGPSRRKEKSES